MSDRDDLGRSGGRAVRAALSTAVALCCFVLLTTSSCSIGNINADRCEADDACVLAFGLGSACNDGFCSDPRSCATGHDCRREFGGGACVEGVCVDTLPLNDNCYIFEPDNLPTRRLTGPDSPIILGAIFSLGGAEGGNAFDMGQVAAVRVAMREINDFGGGNEGRELAMVFCDNDGATNDVQGDAREQLNKQALDYLSGVLGAPAMVGPLSSGDSTVLIGHLLANDYPTLMMSPSATSPSLTNEPDRIEDTDPYGLFWRTCPSDSLQGQVLANDVIGIDPMISKVDVVFIQDPYGQGLADVFTQSYLAGDPTRTVQPRPFEPDSEYATLASLVDADNPDAILIISVQADDTVAILEQLALTGQATKRYFFTDGSKDKAQMIDNPDLSPAVMDMIRNAQGTGPPSPINNPNYQQFDAALFKDFQINGNDFSFLANSYDAGYMVAMGVVFASNGTSQYDGRDVAAGYAQVISGEELIIGATSWGNAKALLTGGGSFNVRGISGTLDFDVSTGEAPGPIEVWKVNSAYTEFEEDFTVEP